MHLYSARHIVYTARAHKNRFELTKLRLVVRLVNTPDKIYLKTDIYVVKSLYTHS